MKGRGSNLGNSRRAEVPSSRARLDGRGGRPHKDNFWTDDGVHPYVVMFINQLFQEERDEYDFNDARN
jgi:hypothetical protein